MLDTTLLFKDVIAKAGHWFIIETTLGIVLIIGYICKILIDRYVWKDEEKKKSLPKTSLRNTIDKELEKRIKEDKKQ